MLDAHIIEELRRREERHRGVAEQPRLEMPSRYGDMPRPVQPPAEQDSEPQQRGVVIIDL